MMPPLFETNCLNKLQIFYIFGFKQIFIGFLGHSKQKSTIVYYCTIDTLLFRMIQKTYKNCLK